MKKQVGKNNQKNSKMLFNDVDEDDENDDNIDQN
jgi:hypothetical protein